MTTALHYPLYVIANELGVLVAASRNKECILLFHRKELAERHIAEAKAIELWYPLEVPNAGALRDGLESLPAHVTCVIWDATVLPGTFVYMEINEMLQAINA